MRNIALFLAVVLLSFILTPGLSAANAETEYRRFSAVIYDVFDTMITLIGYAENENVFADHYVRVNAIFTEYHRLFDAYHTYDGIENLCSINQKAGEGPVEVDQRLFDFLAWCIEQEEVFGTEQVNVAMGSVLQLWHNYREAGLTSPETASLPPMEQLAAAAEHMDIHNVILDPDALTVYFADPSLQLDFGAVAKGYTAQIAADYLAGSDMPSFILNAGGNVCAGQRKIDSGLLWGVGIQDPDILTGNNLFDTIFAENKAVVTSGDYQRYYTVDGQRYAHLISPVTLMPADTFRAVTVVSDDSALCDFLSTLLFIADYDTGFSLVESLPGIEAMWIFPDRSCQYTSGMSAYLRSAGASNQ